MKVYLYAKSGPNVGLDATRRCSAIANLLQNKSCEPILCSNDFKTRTYSKTHLGVKNNTLVDEIEDFKSILKKGDILIYDTDEQDFEVEEFIENTCTLSYKLPLQIPNSIIDEKQFTKKKNFSEKKVFYFGDDDYKEELLKLCEGANKQNISLLWGHFFFSSTKRKFNQYFESIIEDEQYTKTVKETKYLLSTSLHTCLESIASGNKPVLLKREDKKYDMELIKSLHLPVIKEKKLNEIIFKFEKTIKNYPKLNTIDPFDINSIIHDIYIRNETFRKLSI